MQTSRTRLRRVTEADFDNIRRLESNEEVMRYTSLRRALSPDETRERMARWMSRQDDEDFGIFLAEKLDGEFIGWFMLKPGDDESLEIGFMIVQELWGQGFTTEIAARLLEHAGARNVIARTYPENKVSMSVLKKIGFVIDREEPGTVFFKKV